MPKRETSVVERKSYRDAAGNRLHLRLRIQRDGSHVLELERKLAKGATERGILGHFPEGEFSRPAFDKQARQAVERGWTESQGRRRLTLTEIPEADNRERKRPGPQPSSKRRATAAVARAARRGR